jgi:hypothetical protein
MVVVAGTGKQNDSYLSTSPACALRVGHEWMQGYGFNRGWENLRFDDRIRYLLDPRNVVLD